MKLSSKENAVAVRKMTIWEKIFGRCFALLPILFILIVVPLVVKAKAFETGLQDFVWYASQSIEYDFYLYYKQWIFVAACATLFVFFAIYLVKEKIKLSLPLFYLPMLLYAVLAVLSTCLSEYPSFGITGIAEQFENVFCLVGYAMIPFYLYFIVREEEGIKAILGALYIQIILLGIVGLSQVVGENILDSGIIKEFIMWSKDEIPPHQLTGTNVPLTLYNRNYSGVYYAMIIPVLGSLTLLPKKISTKMLNGALALLLLILMFYSGSKAAMIGVAAGVFIIILVLRRKILKYWKQTLVVVGVVVAALAIYFVATEGTYFKQIMASLSSITQKTTHELKKIETLDQAIRVTYNEDILNIEMEWEGQQFESLTLYDDKEQGVAAEYLEEEVLGQNEAGESVVNTVWRFKVNDARFPELYIRPVLLPFSEEDTRMGLLLQVSGEEYYFTNQTEDGTYYFVNWYGKLDKIQYSGSAVFTDYPTLFSGRGYLWAKSIPVLKNTIFLGTGADTFTLYYPQRDYVDHMLNGYGRLLPTKPHCMYIQIGVQTGVVSLICFIVFYLIYFFQTLRLIWKEDFESYPAQVAVALLAGTFAYMVMGITNDSCTAVAPIFFVLLGLGFAVNAMLKRRKTIV